MQTNYIWSCTFFKFIISAVKRYDALAALGAAGMVDIQNLVKWIGKLDLMRNSQLSTNVTCK